MFGSDLRETLEALLAYNERITQSAGLSTIAKHRLIEDSEGIMGGLKAEITHKNIDARIMAIYLDFDKLCFTLSEVDSKMSAHDFKSLNAYEFLRHKQLLEQSLKDKKARK